MPISLAEPTYIGDLGNSLIRRWSSRADEPGIAHLMGSVFRGSPDEPFNQPRADVARILMSDRFPYMGPDDFAIVEDTNKQGNPIVACTCLWRLRWRYGGIAFGVGQPEMVATDAPYRNRGLAHALFEMVHARSAAEGHLVQAITGIRYFYRQFGYEYALDLEGGRIVPVAAIPEKSGDEAEPYSLRLAVLDDIPHLMSLYDLPSGASLVWHEASEVFWRHHIASWDDPIVQRAGPTGTDLYGRLHMVIDRAGEVAGYTWLAAKRWDCDLVVFALQLAANTNWQAAAPGLLRALRIHGEQTPATDEKTRPFSAINLNLGRAHPIYAVLRETLASRIVPPYAWCVRVPDVPGFIQHIAPVLEARIASSIITGYSGDLKVDFYRGGLHLHFAQGRLTVAEPWRAQPYGSDGNAGFRHLFSCSCSSGIAAWTICGRSSRMFGQTPKQLCFSTLCFPHSLPSCTRCVLFDLTRYEPQTVPLCAGWGRLCYGPRGRWALPRHARCQSSSYASQQRLFAPRSQRCAQCWKTRMVEYTQRSHVRWVFLPSANVQGINWRS